MNRSSMLYRILPCRTYANQQQRATYILPSWKKDAIIVIMHLCLSRSPFLFLLRSFTMQRSFAFTDLLINPCLLIPTYPIKHYRNHVWYGDCSIWNDSFLIKHVIQSINGFVAAVVLNSNCKLLLDPQISLFKQGPLLSCMVSIPGLGVTVLQALTCVCDFQKDVLLQLTL